MYVSTGAEEASVCELVCVCIHYIMCRPTHCKELGYYWEWGEVMYKRPDHHHANKKRLLTPAMLNDRAKAKVKALKYKNKCKTWSEQPNAVLWSGNANRIKCITSHTDQAHLSWLLTYREQLAEIHNSNMLKEQFNILRKY